MPQNRWAISIDMEGFSSLWERENKILLSLGKLMCAIYRIGQKCFPDTPERLFTHQIGDGFLVTSEFHERDLERAVTIAVALMRHVAASGRFTKAAISEGDIASITGCYPKEVMNNMNNGRVLLGRGLMTIFPVMGTALIRVAAIAKSSPSGPLLTIKKSKSDRIPQSIPKKPIKDKDLVSIDWVHMETECLSEIQNCAGLKAPSTDTLECMLVDYCEQHKLPDEWISNVCSYLDVDTAKS